MRIKSHLIIRRNISQSTSNIILQHWQVDRYRSQMSFREFVGCLIYYRSVWHLCSVCLHTVRWVFARIMFLSTVNPTSLDFTGSHFPQTKPSPPHLLHILLTPSNQAVRASARQQLQPLEPMPTTSGSLEFSFSLDVHSSHPDSVLAPRSGLL